jgi:hypothetical protein
VRRARYILVSALYNRRGLSSYRVVVRTLCQVLRTPCEAVGSDFGLALEVDPVTRGSISVTYDPRNYRYRPKLAVRDFLSHWPLYFVSRRSLNLSRRTEFGASGHCRISTSDVSKIAADRLL